MISKETAVLMPSPPTQTETIRKCGDQFNKTRLTPTVKKLFTKWLAWRR